MIQRGIGRADALLIGAANQAKRIALDDPNRMLAENPLAEIRRISIYAQDLEDALA